MISFITSQYLSGISKEKTAFLKIFPVLLENSFGFESWTSHFRVVKSALFKAKMKGKDFKEKGVENIQIIWLRSDEVKGKGEISGNPKKHTYDSLGTIS